ncbi:RagB/SusD family nutrient uptake outer membrane protein [Desertivirga brevis]|uniref:RagB/SusD family nutrient uptake outer membrane protein n=1 Tax=Desertivirga brevis TaxID=2810310 RepID=UPI001A967E61|nr:RagB/SusD family nutrient uptake outer membrane protein [Pedobacter sp. SYSU D00873]
MKRFIYSLIAGSLLFASCKNFLDVTPDSLSPSNYYKTDEDINTALTGVYDVLGKTATYGRYLYFEMDVSDESFPASSSWTQDVALFNYDPGDIKLTATWNTLYDGINRANMLLDNIDKSNLTTEKRRVAKGEALFLRAYYYFLLVQNWGSVPMRLTAAKDPNDVNIAKTPYKTIYEQIVKDMEIAADSVNGIDKYNYTGRVSKSAVWGILARVNLKMAGAPLRDVSRYAEARKWAAKVMEAANGHNLNPDYKDVFKKMAADQYDKKEVIWEVEFGLKNGTQDEGGAVGGVNGIGTPNSEIFTKTIGFSYGVQHPTDRYVKLFEAGDVRKDWSVSNYTYNGEGGKVYTPPTLTNYARFAAKWRREYETAGPKFLNTTAINFPLLRYSDVLLMFAEADNEINGPTVDGIAAVNTVRRRAYARPLKTITLTNGGSGYATAPTVVIGGPGSGATATATVSGGKVTSVTLNEIGLGYNTIPTITFDPGPGNPGSGATATAEIYTVDGVLTPEMTANRDAFREVIRAERSRELGFEGLRRFDLVRWGQWVPVMKNLANEIATTAPANYVYAARSGQNISNRDTLLAIPSKEVSLNQSLIQNPGW